MPNSNDFNRFAVNPVNLDISRSLFNMDHSVKWSCNVGDVIPFEVCEVLPGDTFSVDTSKVIRLQPLVAPIMDEVILDTYWFFVPNRLVWNHWINMMGENTESAWYPQTEYFVPQIYPPTGGWQIGTIADYMGIPPLATSGSGAEPTVSALPFRAYALICDQWFRSEALMDPVHVHMDDTMRGGVNTGDQVTDIELGGKPFIACKYFDYFTGCLPSPQRGRAVELDIVDSEYYPVVSMGSPLAETHPFANGKLGSNAPNGYMAPTFSNKSTGDTVFHTPTSPRNVGFNTYGYMQFNNTNATYVDGGYAYFSNLFTQINVSPISINELRTAFAMQKYLERSARYGGRYIEFIKGFFSVDSPDSRLQRTEYLGGSRLSLNINSVEQTSATETGLTPLGSVAGMSVTADMNSDFTKSFTEHGFLIGCAVVRYHHSYQQSVNRMWLRHNKYEFYNPVFANLGEQAVYTTEIYANDGYHPDGTSDGDPHVFGYQERWAEYRYQPNRIAGELRTIASNSLDMWHLGDYYTQRPYLSAEWIREDKSNLDRCLAVTSDVANQVICDFYIKMEASRPMPLYSIPGLIDHH